jgi:hypothetical protein
MVRPTVKFKSHRMIHCGSISRKPLVARPDLLARIVGKPPHVIWRRGWQELHIQSMHLLGGWRRLESRNRRFWADSTVDRFCSRAYSPLLIAPDALESFQLLAEDREELSDELTEHGAAVRDRRFEVLGSPVPGRGAWPWRTDWCFEKTWEHRFFRHYDFYESRDRAYDVKRPWELSRFGFLVPLLQFAVLRNDEAAFAFGIDLVADWERDNPCAHSINWQPMESAMRVINLVQAFEVARRLPQARPGQLSVLLRQISLNAGFVWRTLEYTYPNGNHYAANIVSLLLAGLLLQDFFPAAARWQEYAGREVATEARAQFLEDGVNFEKSMHYHHLVTELFLVAKVAADRRGLALSGVIPDVLRTACRYLVACQRPDQLWPNVGDNDGARVFRLQPVQARDYRPLLALASAVLDESIDADLSSFGAATVAWVLGRDGLERLSRSAEATVSHWHLFEHGGVVVAGDASTFLWLDVGEVGLAGRGGHGHNDMLSFELALGGSPVVIDPGCPVYSGDVKLALRFKSTAAHNGLRVDEEEIAPIVGLFRISDDARPSRTVVTESPEGVEITAGHDGYERLADPVRHQRRIELGLGRGWLHCQDTLDCAGQHRVERFLHFHPGLEARLGNGELHLTRDNLVVAIVKWSPSSHAVLQRGLVSPTYGSLSESWDLVLRDHITGPFTLCFSIECSAEWAHRLELSRAQKHAPRSHGEEAI